MIQNSTDNSLKNMLLKNERTKKINGHIYNYSWVFKYPPTSQEHTELLHRKSAGYLTTVKQQDLTDICRKLQATTGDYIFFSNAHKMLNKIDCVPSLTKSLKNVWNLNSIVSSLTTMELN